MSDSQRRTTLLELKARGEELFGKGDVDGALTCFTKLVEATDLDRYGMKKWAVLQNLAVIYLTAGRLTEAYKHIMECIRLAEAETSATSSSGLAQAYRMKEDIEGRMTTQGAEAGDEADKHHEEKSKDEGNFEEWNAFQTKMAMLARTGAGSVSQFERLLHGAPDWQRTCIARALGAVKPAKKPLVRCLEQLLTDTNEKVREIACDALGKIGGEAAYGSINDAFLGGLLGRLFRGRRKIGVSRTRAMCRAMLERALSDSAQSVKQAAERAIARIDAA